MPETSSGFIAGAVAGGVVAAAGLALTYSLYCLVADKESRQYARDYVAFERQQRRKGKRRHGAPVSRSVSPDSPRTVSPPVDRRYYGEEAPRRNPASREGLPPRHPSPIRPKRTPPAPHPRELTPRMPTAVFQGELDPATHAVSPRLAAIMRSDGSEDGFAGGEPYPTTRETQDLPGAFDPNPRRRSGFDAATTSEAEELVDVRRQHVAVADSSAHPSLPESLVAPPPKSLLPLRMLDNNNMQSSVLEISLSPRKGGHAAARSVLPPPHPASSVLQQPSLLKPALSRVVVPPVATEGGLPPLQSDPCEEYSRMIMPEVAVTVENEEVAHMLLEMLQLRRKWLFKPNVSPEDLESVPEAAVQSERHFSSSPFAYDPPPPAAVECRMVDGVMHVYDAASGDPGGESGGGGGGARPNLFPVPGTARDYFGDLHEVLKVAAGGPMKSFCHHRLVLLEQQFNMHVMLNSEKEYLAQKAAPHRDFYNVRKVDTHVHHSACMHQKHLIRFIKSKLRKEPDEVVIFRDGKYLTLKEVFESLNLTGYDLNVDTLDMHADKTIFHRFDKFNLKYNPCGQSRLREIFIKQDNLIHGRFLAELTQEVFEDLEASKYQHTEYRISIYGRKQVEWDILAAWVCNNKLYSDNNMWLIQLPRLYNIYRAQGIVENFEQMLANIFVPLFEVTADASSHPQLHIFLNHVSGFDMVDDESKPERRPTKNMPTPAEWDNRHNPAYAFYCYYVYANLFALNRFRESRGLNTFTLRPHAGESGDVDHLAATFLCCENIAHGINLRKSPCLQYLYYLAQIGLCMSPLSNNSLFLDYHKNPFPSYFARGLSVSLSSDDPVQIHLTREPLVEEYSVAAQVWKLSSTDLCEVVRNGVLHSGFDTACKKHWVGDRFWMLGPEGNDIQKTNVCNLRLRFRHDVYQNEWSLVASGALAHQARLDAAALQQSHDQYQ